MSALSDEERRVLGQSNMRCFRCSSEARDDIGSTIRWRLNVVPLYSFIDEDLKPLVADRLVVVCWDCQGMKP